MTEDQFRSGQTLTFASGKPRFRTIVLFGFIAVLAIVAFITGNSRTVAPPENAAGLVVMFMTFSTRFRHRRHTQLPPYSEALLPFHIVPPEPGAVAWVAKDDTSSSAAAAADLEILFIFLLLDFSRPPHDIRRRPAEPIIILVSLASG
jgi:hypothetical protein